MALSWDERVALLRFALRTFPSSLATSAVVVVARGAGIDDTLLSSIS
jgi:hypothetical protein